METQKLNFEPGAPLGNDGIPLCVPEIRGNEWLYIKQCLDTNFVSSVGPFVDRFERYFGSLYRREIWGSHFNRDCRVAYRLAGHRHPT